MDDVLWLRGYWSHPDNVWLPADILVYARDGRALLDEVGVA
jgi:hypothetical protein